MPLICHCQPLYVSLCSYFNASGFIEPTTRFSASLSVCLPPPPLFESVSVTSVSVSIYVCPFMLNASNLSLSVSYVCLNLCLSRNASVYIFVCIYRP